MILGVLKEPSFESRVSLLAETAAALKDHCRRPRSGAPDLQRIQARGGRHVRLRHHAGAVRWSRTLV